MRSSKNYPNKEEKFLCFHNFHEPARIREGIHFGHSIPSSALSSFFSFPSSFPSHLRSSCSSSSYASSISYFFPASLPFPPPSLSYFLSFFFFQSHGLNKEQQTIKTNQKMNHTYQGILYFHNNLSMKCFKDVDKS